VQVAPVRDAARFDEGQGGIAPESLLRAVSIGSGHGLF
jgi:hypothetical protein